jgi:hypothetical protein
MSLFFDLLSSINNPNQNGSVSQLEGITSTIQTAAAERGIPASQLQSVLTSLGGFLGPALQNQQNLPGGVSQLSNVIGQIAGGGAGGGTAASTIQSLFPPQVQQQLIQGIAQKTGISPNTLQGLLPVVLPAVLSLINMGGSKPGTAGGTNPLLSAFLNNAGGGNDLGEVFNFANRFLNPAH